MKSTSTNFIDGTDFINAAIDGNLNSLKVMLERNPSLVNYVDETKASALHYAAANDNEDMVEFLLTKGGDINAQDIEGNTPLHLAVSNAELNAACALIRNTANMDIPNIPTARFPEGETVDQKVLRIFDSLERIAKLNAAKATASEESKESSFETRYNQSTTPPVRAHLL
jgi:ankyrin repeat protein